MKTVLAAFIAYRLGPFVDSLTGREHPALNGLGSKACPGCTEALGFRFA